MIDSIQKVKSISIWIFIIPFVGINTCLVLITQFHEFFPNHEDIVHNTLWPYLDGGLSISRAARPYPSWLIFKPGMFLTSFLLIKYWLYNKEIIIFFNKNPNANGFNLVNAIHFKELLFLIFSFSSSFFRALFSPASVFFWVTHVFLFYKFLLTLAEGYSILNWTYQIFYVKIP